MVFLAVIKAIMVFPGAIMVFPAIIKAIMVFPAAIMVFPAAIMVFPGAVVDITVGEVIPGLADLAGNVFLVEKSLLVD